MRTAKRHGPATPHLQKRRLSSGLILAIAVAGCSMMQPYEIPDNSPKPDPKSDLVLAGGAGEAIDIAEGLRKTYYENLRWSALTRNGTAVVAAGLSGWAIYRGLEPSSVGSGTASPADKRTTLRLGVVLASLYGLREFFVNPDQESAYAEGYRSLTCLMLASRPLLMTQTNQAKAPSSAPAYFREPVITSNNVLPQPYTVRDLGDLDRLEQALDKLEQAILQVNFILAEDTATADEVAAGNADLLTAQKDLRAQFDRTEKALVYARNALADGRFLVRTIRGAGGNILTRVHLIAATVNDQVKDHQHDLATAATSLKNAQDITSSVLNIGTNTAADQAAGASDDSKATISGARSSGRPILLAGPMSAAWGPLFGGTSAWSAAAVTAGSSASAPKAADGGASSASIVPKAVTPKKTKPKATPEPKSSSSPAMTVDDLKKIRDAIDKSIDVATKAEQQAAAASAAAALAAREKAIRKKAEEANRGMTCASNAVGQRACARDIALQTELLFAARRPVAQELSNFRRLARDATVTPECSDLAVLRVQPNEARVALAGETLTYVISQRASGNPIVALNGPSDAQSGVTLTLTPIEGASLIKAAVSVGPTMPRQNVQLVVSDSKGITSQILPIVAGGSRPKPLEAAAAKASDASSAASSSTKGKTDGKGS